MIPEALLLSPNRNIRLIPGSELWYIKEEKTVLHLSKIVGRKYESEMNNGSVHQSYFIEKSS